SFFFSSIISGKLAGFTDTLGYTQIFGLISGIVIVFGVILILLRKGLLRLMSLDEFNK
ncbi:MFS transporter, partial [Clostridium botulinum]|nr:MFS transporter [Clostridium botulinum]MBZ1332770.1 MFS transporter [Clostridium botulinum]MBZ1336530.1 MFS transporter [Clostridium botulinum]MBZ1341394.1 MFS transporter [Clostridium botulinum]MBZ1344860.1 MFS transporter [Clostridium botulinum]